jgi:NAD(P)-dependent dehydrogenase (short-subunit alcohol dehydrogenase family)
MAARPAIRAILEEDSMSASMICSLPETVVVTGASSGLGTAICRLLVDCRVNTFGVDVGEPPNSLSAPNYKHFKGDVAADAVWQEVSDSIGSQTLGSLGLVSNAAILEVGTILDFDRAAMDRTMSVNFIGTAMALKAILPHMIERKAGAIVAVASIDATFAEQQLAVYAASKGAVRQLARTVAMDHARSGIRTNVLSPGPMMAGLFERHMKSANDPEKFYNTRAARQPSGEITSPNDVARVVLFLLSDGANAINGADVIVDGGLTTSFDFRTGAEGASV